MGFGRLIDSHEFLGDIEETFILDFVRSRVVMVVTSCTVSTEAVRVVDSQVPSWVTRRHHG